jgi:hypothetical protein
LLWAARGGAAVYIRDTRARRRGGGARGLYYY